MRLGIILITAIIGMSLLIPYSSLAGGPIQLNLEYPGFTVGGTRYDPNEAGGQDLNRIVAWAYYFFVTISGFSAFFVIVLAGFTWLTSRGNPNAIAGAKDQITSAFLGLVIILAAWLILQIINPDLTTLRLPTL